MLYRLSGQARIHRPISGAGYPLREKAPATGDGYAGSAPDLPTIARRRLEHDGLPSQFPANVVNTVNAIPGPAKANGDPSIRDLTGLCWISLDNADSQDLDQVTYAERLPNGDIRILFAVSDTDALVPKDGIVDGHSRQVCTTVYTPGAVFPMFPPKLSTDYLSLNQGQDRLAVVTELIVGPDGQVKSEDMFRATVRNHAQMVYSDADAWLADAGRAPAGKDPEALGQLKLQKEAAGALHTFREKRGLVQFGSANPKPRVEDGRLVGAEPNQDSPTSHLIEEFSVANGEALARYLARHNSPSVQRGQDRPVGWESLRDTATGLGDRLPTQPDRVALTQFLQHQQELHPDRYPELTATVGRALGPARYEVVMPGKFPTGHWSLGAPAYATGSASIRRRCDLLNLRLAKDAIAGRAPSYTEAQLQGEILLMTARERAAKRIERELNTAALAALATRIPSRTTVITGPQPLGYLQTR